MPGRNRIEIHAPCVETVLAFAELRHVINVIMPATSAKIEFICVRDFQKLENSSQTHRIRSFSC